MNAAEMNRVLVDIEVYDDASWRLAAIAATYCPVCRHYRDRRGFVIVLEAIVLATFHGLDVDELLRRYLGSVHRRHLAGECLSTRPRTPDRQIPGGVRVTVKRACNGCQADLGDARPDELDAAMVGRPLPDVRYECGCWPVVA